MSDSNRNLLAALVGLALFFPLFVSAFHGALDQPGQERNQPYRFASDKPVELEAPAPGGSVSQPFDYRTPCDNPKGQNESDLCAQWKSANAAEDSALWAKWGFWIAVVGSSLLLWQIILTRRAVRDTSDATEAMIDANAIAEDAKRAWLSCDVSIIQVAPNADGASAEIKIRAQIKNVGQTACLMRLDHIEVSDGLDDVNQEFERLASARPEAFNKTDNLIPLVPGEVYTVEMDRKLPGRLLPPDELLPELRGRPCIFPCVIYSASYRGLRGGPMRERSGAQIFGYFDDSRKLTPLWLDSTWSEPQLGSITQSHTMRAT
tara:strand:- start:258 stop:1214 length:957 start_codon:yes stop_codon:yes gene_type:complete